MASALTGADGANEMLAPPPLPQGPEFSASLKLRDPVLPPDERFLEAPDAAINTDSVPADSGSWPNAPISLPITSQIAAAIVRPLEVLNIDHAPFGALKLDDARSIAKNPFFTEPLNRAAARLSGLCDIDISDKNLRRLGFSIASQLCIQLTTGNPDHLKQSCLLLGAIVLHKHLLTRAMKAERDMLQQLLGADTYRIATREAPVLHALLADLDDGSFSFNRDFATNMEQARETGLAIIAVGQKILHDFVDMTEPSLSPLLAFRQSSHPHPEGQIRKTTAMTDRQGAHIIRLLRRRFEPWSHTIV